MEDGYISPAAAAESQSRRQVGSIFGEALTRVRSQIESGNLPLADRAIGEEVAMIIAEVYILPDTYDVRIAGGKLPAGTVKEIFEKIDAARVAEVIRRYRAIRYEIKHTKTYLRTALYNSVFEFESRLENEVRSEWGPNEFRV